MLRRAFSRVLLLRTRPARLVEIAEVRFEPLERFSRLRMNSYKFEHEDGRSYGYNVPQRILSDRVM